MLRILKSLFPTRLKHALKMEVFGGLLPEIRKTFEQELDVRVKEALSGSDVVLKKEILPELYDPWTGREIDGLYSFDASDLEKEEVEGTFPVPPPLLRMGYRADSAKAYLDGAAETHAFLQEVLTTNGVVIDETSAVLDWGCATGRLLRQYRAEAEAGGTFWGADQDENCVLWAKEFLSPPFNFVTCTAYPHLPFEDNSFDLVYAISVFTHIEHLTDAWLMELRRVLKPGGHLMVSVHTEGSVERIATDFWPPWLPRETAVEELAKHDFSVVTSGAWDFTFPFFKEEYVRKEWGRYYDVVAIESAQIDFAQTVVLMRKA